MKMKNHIDKATKGKIRKMLKFEVKNLQTDLTEKEWEEWGQLTDELRKEGFNMSMNGNRWEILFHNYSYFADPTFDKDGNLKGFSLSI